MFKTSEVSIMNINWIKKKTNEQNKNPKQNKTMTD